MANAVNIRVNDREFRQTLRQYIQVSRRTIPEIVNSKAYFIARRAIYETPKANKLTIGKSLSQLLMSFKATAKGGRMVLKTVTRFGRLGQTTQVPLAAILVNWQRGQRGKKGLYGEQMRAAVEHFILNRQRTIAFIRSGWLPAVKILAPYVPRKTGAAPLDPETKQRGRQKGSAVPAQEGFRVTARIENAIAAGGKNAEHHGEAVNKYAIPALQRAFANEEKSMRQYMEDKLRDSAKKVGIRTN